MDNMSISKGPGLKDLVDSLARKRLLYQHHHDADLVQCVVFETNAGWVYVLINALQRPNLEDEPWKFQGRVVQQGETRYMTWIPCHGEYSTVSRTGWLKEGL